MSIQYLSEPGHLPLISVSFEGTEVVALVDTGAGLGFCSEFLYITFNFAMDPPKFKILVGDGRGIAVLGSAKVDLQFCGSTKNLIFHVVPSKPQHCNVILGFASLPCQKENQ